MSDLRERLESLTRICAALPMAGEMSAQGFTVTAYSAGSERPLLDKEQIDKLIPVMQAELAALVRKAAAIARRHDGGHLDSSYEGHCEDVGYCPAHIVREIETLLTQPMAALAEHDSGIRAECNGEWLNMIVRLFGPIPCGGTSLEIAERHLAQVRAEQQLERLTKAETALAETQDRILEWSTRCNEWADQNNELATALAEAQKHAQLTMCSYCGKISDCGSPDLDAKRKVALDHILECDKRPEVQLIDAGIEQMKQIAALQGALREWKCPACGGSRIFKGYSKGKVFSPEDKQPCNVCKDTEGLHPTAFKALTSAAALLEGK